MSEKQCEKEFKWHKKKYVKEIADENRNKFLIIEFMLK